MIRTLTWVALLATCTVATAQRLPTAREVALNGVWTLASPVGAVLRTAKNVAPPLNVAGEAIYRERRALLAGADNSFDLSAKCKPIGFPRSLWDGAPFDLQVQRNLVFFGFTWNRNHRTANFSDQPPTLQIPRYYGTATVHWDGDQLIVQSGMFNTNTLLDASGLPHSEDMLLLERYRSLNGGKQLEVRLTITDPTFYTKPWNVALRYNRDPRGRIAEDVCEERSEFYKPLLSGR
jgi:hypothetical protein